MGFQIIELYSNLYRISEKHNAFSGKILLKYLALRLKKQNLLCYMYEKKVLTFKNIHFPYLLLLHIFVAHVSLLVRLTTLQQQRQYLLKVL